jgi:hypothetical protein
MEQRAAELEAEVAKWLEAAEATDAEEDKRSGELGFGRSLRLCLQFSLGLANALSALKCPTYLAFWSLQDGSWRPPSRSESLRFDGRRC